MEACKGRPFEETLAWLALMCSARREHLKKGVSFVAERARESASRVDRVIVARLHVSKEMRPPGVREGARRGLLARKASRLGLHASLLLIASQGGSRNGGGWLAGGWCGKWPVTAASSWHSVTDSEFRTSQSVFSGSTVHQIHHKRGSLWFAE